MLASEKNDLATAVLSVRPGEVVFRYCHKHHSFNRELLIKTQKADKKVRNELNRQAGPRHNRLMKEVNRLIDDRRHALSSPYSVGWCPICDSLDIFGYNTFIEGLSSSTVEHLICNQDVLGSIPGSGSNKLRFYPKKPLLIADLITLFSAKKAAVEKSRSEQAEVQNEAKP
jgi:hypothetical protein